jgi:DNA-directed RNA polymerase specialized sigma24 family protein
MDDLRTMFERGLRLFLVRRGVENLDDISRIVLRCAADLVRQAPADPATLPSHVRTAMNEIRPPNGRAGIGMQPVEAAEAREALASLDGSEREALLRFYLREQRSAQICQDMGFSEYAFSALRSRVRAKYFELTRPTLKARGTAITPIL